MNKEIDIRPEDNEAIQAAMQWLVMEFLRAVARTHPNPAALLEAFKDEIQQRKEDEEPFTELTPSNQRAYQVRQIHERALIHLLNASLLAAIGE